ncbi:MAG: hypothetical protein KDF60_03785, partial [Calditrichaeota bacterium]|nr:hypothetical protein [Calditrichota bacterium]
GYSRYPRGVYRFDLTKGKIINKFESPASFTQLALFDINNDHKEEIILGSTATDNFPDSVAFSDVYSWIFVMDQKLDKLFVQKSINRYGGSWFITAFDETMPVLYGLNIYKERNLKIIKVDHSLEIKDSLFIKGYVAGDYWLDDSNHFNVFLKGWDKRSLVKFDPALNIVDAKELEIPVDTEIRSIDDIDNDGLKNYYLRTMSTLFLLDENFDKIAEIKLGEDERLDDISILRQKRKNNILGINTTKYSYVFNLNPSWIYKWKWPLFILEILVFYGLFFVLHILINKIRIYISYFIFSITESDNAVILINHKQNIIAFNSRVEDILGLANAVKRQQNYQKTLQNRNEIVAVIDESINKKAPVKKEISYDTFNKNFIGTVKVSPFKSYFNFINAYLVEIQDNTDQILNERQMNWQRNLRRMIHDIKNPLAGVQFKLQSIYLKMSDKDPELAAELEGEIEIANSEIKRIRNISKDFLKFSNLEAIQPRFLKLDELIIRCINHFRAYQNNNLKIQNIIDDKIPEVFWDARQIELLLHIVIENAIDAVKGSGQLLLKTELVQNLNIIEEEFVKIMIADTGCGIEEEDINKIFQPNFSLKPEGSGMGLVFAKQIVQQHKGSIWLEKFEGFSTAFIISIPAIPKTG